MTLGGLTACHWKGQVDNVNHRVSVDWSQLAAFLFIFQVAVHFGQEARPARKSFKSGQRMPSIPAEYVSRVWAAGAVWGFRSGRSQHFDNDVIKSVESHWHRVCSGAIPRRNAGTGLQKLMAFRWWMTGVWW
jgi:hypothetical protein